MATTTAERDGVEEEQKKRKQGGFRTMPFILGNLILVSLLHKCCFFSLLDQAHMITSEHD
jgi:hypothetical protein